MDNVADYGDCGVRSLMVTPAAVPAHDVSVAKRIALDGRSNVELRLEMLNAFNHHSVIPLAGIGDDPADFVVTRLPGTNQARVVQVVSRINW